MRKLKLSLDALVVETFAPAAPVPDVGTVRANASGPYTDECVNCNANTVDGCSSHDEPCASQNNWTCSCGTCYNNWTCGANTCAAGQATCDGDTCYNDTCSFPQCTMAGIPC